MATLTTSYQLLKTITTSTYTQLRLYGKYNSQSTDNNTSSVSLQLRLYGNGGSGSFSSGTAKISGTSYSLGNTSYSKGSEKTLCTKTYTATHSSDGTYTASISFSITTSGSVSGSGSVSITLPQIKRTSVLGSISDFTFGNSITISYTEYVASYTANLKILIGSTLVKTITNISSGDSVSFTSGELNTIYGLAPNTTTPTVTFQLVTMNGATQIGTNSKNATGTIPNSVAPSLSSLTLEDNLGYEQQIGDYVQNKSVIHGTITASGGTGASISSIVTQINGETIYGDEFYTNELETAGTNYYSILITDTRGRSKTYTGSFSVIAYNSPTIDFNVYRSNSLGNLDDNGNYICINLDSTIDSLNNENSKEFKIEYRQEGGAWTTLTTYNSSYNYVLTNSVYSGFSSSYPFDVKITATDTFGSEYVQIWIPTAKTVLDFYHDGTGVAIGKVADTGNLFDVAYDTEIESDLTVDGDLYVAGGNTPRNILDEMGDLSTLTTTTQSSLVVAINELDANNIEEMYNPNGVGNGYIKFKNGIIYEWILKQVTTTSSVYGPLWYTDHSLGNWAVPILEFFSFGSTVNNYNYWSTINGMGNTSAGLVRMYRANNGSGNKVYINVWAIGTWK